MKSTTSISISINRNAHKKDKKEYEAITDAEIQGIEQRIKKHLHGIEGLWTVDTMLNDLTPYFYTQEDERKMNIPAPPRPPTTPQPKQQINIDVIQPSTFQIQIVNREELQEKRKEYIQSFTPPPSVQNTQERTTIENYITPQNNDTLFWSIFIATYGLVEYYHIGRNYGTKELEIKQKIAEDIQRNTHTYRNTAIQSYKLTKPVLQEVASELLTSCRETTIECMLVMMIYFKKEVIFISQEHKVYLEFLFQPSNHTTPIILHLEGPISRGNGGANKDSNRKYKYSVYMETDIEKQEEYRKNLQQSYIKVDNYHRALKPASYYKMEDLEEMRVKIEEMRKETETKPEKNKKMKKAELYEYITKGLVGFYQ